MKIAVVSLALAAGLSATSASASILNGTMGFIPFGAAGTFVGPNLAQATSFNWGSSSHLINNPGTATFNGLPNVFNGFALSNVTVSGPITLPGGVTAFAPPVTLNNSYPSLFTVAFGGANVRFSSTSQSFTSSGPNSLNITFVGTAVDLNNVHSGIANAAMTMNFTILSGNQVNYSTSFATSGLVPTPGAMALLGAGGLLAMRRRR